MTILTPDQRIRVFISSTLEELAPERLAARRAVEALHLSPVWYESGARPHPPRSMYRAYLAQSQVFVGIYWQRYGWVGPGMDVSGLEDEYRLALGMPMLLYIKRPAPDQEPRLAQFLAGMKDSGVVSYRSFSSADELQSLLSDDLALLLSESFLSTGRSGPETEAGAVAPGGSGARQDGPRPAPVRGNLPLRLTSFIGRECSASRLKTALETSRLVTVTGPGGVGKSRLALEVASSVEDAYPDGSWLCELAPAADETSMAAVVARVLGVSQRQGMSVEASIVDQLRDRCMLVILDNCEQVLEGAGRLAGEILRSCPVVRLLVTSRESLDVEGEQVVRLGPLAVPAPTAGFDAIAAGTAVRLFAERAAAIRSDFVLRRDNAAAVAEICGRLDGIPLAIELAAARIDTLSPGEMTGLLDQRFELLTAGRRSAAERHQTLRAVIDWSYSLLSPIDQDCFCRLGVFSGTFDVDAVAAVADPGPDPWRTRDILGRLVAKSMVIAEETVAGPTRYRLFESLRQYALERLREAGELDARQALHAGYFAAFSERAGPALLGPDELVWRARLRAELANLRSAVSWAVGACDGAGDAAVRTAAALAPYALFERAGEISALVEQAVPRAETAPARLRSAVLGAAAFAAFQNHADVVAAERLTAMALEEGVPAGSAAPAHAYATRMVLLGWAGRTEEARAVAEEAVATIDGIGAAGFHRAMIRQAIAASAAIRGDDACAGAMAAEALDIARSTGMPSGLAVALWAAALVNVRSRPEEALGQVGEAVDLMRTGASDAVLGHVLAIRAQLLSTRGDLAAALADLRESIEVSHAKGDRTMLTVGLDRGITVVGRTGRSDAVATLTGVCLDGALAAVSTLPLAERRDREAVIDLARADLGEAAFAAARARGAGLSVDEATAFVVDVVAALGG